MPIELEHVSYAYLSASQQKTLALDDISLKIEDGEFVGVMGRTGCGKSTLVQLMAGLIVPVAGKILLDRADINAANYDRSILRNSVGVVFQYPEYQLFETTVEKDVAFGLKYSGLTPSEVKERIKWSLESVEFNYEDIRYKSPLSLSGGEKRRAAIAGVLALRPKILIFDEPIAGLDPMGRESFLRLMSQLRRDGTTIIMISHNADALGEHAERLIILNNGSIFLDGSVKSVFSDLNMLDTVHLTPSTPRIIANMLANRNIAVPQDITSYGELVTALKLYIKETHVNGGDYF